MGLTMYRSENNKIYTIAEIGINHNGDVDLAKKMIDMAIIAGFNSVKFQKRNPDMIPERMKGIEKNTPWGIMSYLDYKKKIEFGLDEYQEIDRYCREKNIHWFASVWDKDSADFMMQFTDVVKIPSAKLTDIELLEYCKGFKCRLLSTGMSSEDQICKAVGTFDPHVIFHTNSSYPSCPDELNLMYIVWLKNKYDDKIIGYSGHEFGIETTYLSIALGATWIERHITLDRYMWGSDQKASLEPEGMLKLIRGIKNCYNALGDAGPRKIGESERKKLESLR
jgi:N-acetylneuraminate synthase